MRSIRGRVLARSRRSAIVCLPALTQRRERCTRTQATLEEWAKAGQKLVENAFDDIGKAPREHHGADTRARKHVKMM